MKVQINGEQVDLKEELTITELLEVKDVEMPEMVSVELNGDILAREGFDNQVIKDGDKVEFLYFMGGGSFGF